MAVDLSNYVDVPQRIKEFREKYPEGTLQQVDMQFISVGEEQFVVYTAAAYRSPDDPRPGHGTAWEPIPGKTPYTRNSEVQNAETSAWGRAIIAVGAADASKIASREEVRNRQGEDRMGELVRLLTSSGISKADQKHIIEIAVERPVPRLEVLKPEEVELAITAIQNAMEEGS